MAVKGELIDVFFEYAPLFSGVGYRFGLVWLCIHEEP
jgi:hypothetical protein